MKEFHIYAHPEGDIEAVKVGWSWPGFFFTGLWALIKRLWTIGAAVLAGLLVVAMATTPGETGGSTSMVFNGLALAISAIFGQFGNAWLEADLGERDYTYRATIRARDRVEAVAAYTRQPPEPQAGLSSG